MERWEIHRLPCGKRLDVETAIFSRSFSERETGGLPIYVSVPLGLVSSNVAGKSPGHGGF